MMKTILPIIFCLITTQSYGGIFGTSSYEECVLDGLKNTNSESSVYLLRATCKQKFQKESEKNVIYTCSLTWNGKNFYSGRPENTDNYSKISFGGTSDVLYVPINMVSSATQLSITSEKILKEKQKIQSICPGIVLESQDLKK